MELARRTGVLAPLAAIMVVGAVGLIRPGSLQAGEPPWDPPPCPPGHAIGTGAAWYTLKPTLDGAGWLTGRRLAIGDLAGDGARRLDLPPESFASGPVGGRLLVGDDDGFRSRLRIVDATAGCVIEVGREAGSVIRSAVMAADGRTAWEHRVDRVTRSDEGVWRRPLDGGEPVRVLPGLAFDAGYGVTFSTELLLAADGRVAVASCGEDRCRIRVLDPRTGGVGRIDDTGPLLGIAESLAIAYAACPGLPCPVESTDLRTGRRETVVASAGPAAVSRDGRALVNERADGQLELVDLSTFRRTTLVAGAPGSPVRGGSAASVGADVLIGGVLLAPAAIPSDPAAALSLVDTTTGTVRALAEIRP